MTSSEIGELRSSAAPTSGDATCSSCDEPLRNGERYLPDEEGGVVHAGCRIGDRDVAPATWVDPRAATTMEKAIERLGEASLSLVCRHYPTPGGDDGDVGYEVVGYHMAKPVERVEGYGARPIDALRHAGLLALSVVPAGGRSDRDHETRVCATKLVRLLDIREGGRDLSWWQHVRQARIDLLALLSIDSTSPDARPIDEAPCVGRTSPILVFWRGVGWRQTYWDEDETFAHRPGGWKAPRRGWRRADDPCIPSDQENATHWRPMPADPS